jgi:hypothetical protein
MRGVPSPVSIVVLAAHPFVFIVELYADDDVDDFECTLPSGRSESASFPRLLETNKSIRMKTTNGNIRNIRFPEWLDDDGCW